MKFIRTPPKKLQNHQSTHLMLHSLPFSIIARVDRRRSTGTTGVSPISYFVVLNHTSYHLGLCTNISRSSGPPKNAKKKHAPITNPTNDRQHIQGILVHEGAPFVSAWENPRTNCGWMSDTELLQPGVQDAEFSCRNGGSSLLLLLK